MHPRQIGHHWHLPMPAKKVWTPKRTPNGSGILGAAGLADRVNEQLRCGAIRLRLRGRALSGDVRYPKGRYLHGVIDLRSRAGSVREKPPHDVC